MGQSRMDNPETQATLDTGHRTKGKKQKTQTQKTKMMNATKKKNRG